MPATKYTYSISGQFSSGVAPDSLEAAIRASSIVTAHDHIATAGDGCDIWFRDALSAGDVTTLDAVVAAHDGEHIPGGDRDSHGNPIVNLHNRQADDTPYIAVRSRFGKETIYATHNLCDPTTWFNESARVTNKALTNNNGVWESGDPHWIDLTHGKVFDEEGAVEDQGIFNPGNPHGYAVTVTVDGVAKDTREPFAASGGDYTIDYSAGTITPVSENWAGQDVRASYSKKSGSGWILRSVDSRYLIIEKAEVQFAANIDFNSTFRVTVYGTVDFFAPQLLQSNGGPLPSGTPIPLEASLYKTVDQIIDEAVESYPEIPPFTPAGARGYTQSRYIFQFHYASARPLFSSLGMSMRISIDGDEPYGGERATATFYCLSKTDPGPATALAILAGD
jgi:hypothetical protein